MAVRDVPEHPLRGSSMVTRPLDEVSSGPSRSDVSWAPESACSASHTCSSRGSITAMPPTTFRTSCVGGDAHTHQA